MKKKRGFSLLEILIALAVMLVGMIGTLSLFPVGLRSAKVSSNLTRAILLSERLLEGVKRAGYSSLSVGTSSWTQFTTTDDTDFWWREIVTDPGITDLLQVEIQIGWNDRGTAYDSNYRNFFTYVADN